MWTMTLLSVALADYIAPPPDVMLSQSTAVFEATVTGFRDDGHATLEVHEVFVGEVPATLRGAVWACYGGSVEGYGVVAGQRYVIASQGQRLTEMASYFEVRGDDVHFWQATSTAKEWTAREAVRQRVRALHDR